MESPQPPMIATRLRQIVFFFAVMIIHAVQLVLTFTNSLAHHAARFDPHLPISLANTIAICQNTLVKITGIFLALGEILVLVVAQICRLGYGDDAHLISDLPEAIHVIFLPLTAGRRDESPPHHHSQAKSTVPNPGLPDSHVEFGAAHTVNVDSLPVGKNTQAMREISALLLYMATSILERYLKERKTTDLAVSIDVLHVAKGLHPPSYLLRSNTFSTLAIAIFIRYRRSPKESDISQAIALHREALNFLRPNEPAHSSSLTILEHAATAWCRQHGGDVGILDVSDACHEAHIIQPPRYRNQFLEKDSSPSNGLHRPVPQTAASPNAAAMSGLKRYQREGGAAVLANSIQLFRQALLLVPLGHSKRTLALNNLAIALTTQYERDGGQRDLSEAIMLHREALSLSPPGHPNRSVSLNKLAGAVNRRHQRHGGERNLLEAITLYREALLLYPPGHPDRSTPLNNLAGAILTRYQLGGGGRDLLEAITLHREALSLLPPGHHNRSALLTNLAGTVTARYDRDGGEQDLSEAISPHQEALSLRPPGHPDRSASLNNLAGVVLTRYKRDGKERDLLDAIKLHRGGALTSTTRVRYERNGRERDLSEAITLYQEALSLRPSGHPNHFASVSNLARAITTRYPRDGRERDLLEAIALNREAVSLLPYGHPERPASLNNFAGVVFTRYMRDGGEENLSDAITLYREALSLFSPGHPDRSSLLYNLAGAVLRRYQRDGGERDLVEAITLNREALFLLPPGHPIRSLLLSNLAKAVLTRYERDGGERDLSETITLHREALSLQPPGHPDRSYSLNRLAGAVLTRYEREGGVQNLSEAITLHREVLSFLPTGHPDRSASLNNLAGAINTRYQRYGVERDLSEVIMLHQEALSSFPPGHPNRSASLRNLATALFRRYLRTRMDQNFTLMVEIIQLFRDATAARTSPIPVRLQAALEWIGIAVKHSPKSALEAYRSAFAHLGSALALAPSLQARHTNLLSQSKRSQPPKNLALDAAIWALNGTSANPNLAVELLDQGRNVLLASVGQFRADLSDVRRLDPTLADEFYRTSRVLDSVILTGQEISQGKSPHEDPTTRYKRISIEWEAIIAKIRVLPGCESFLLPVPYIRLQEAAVDGPVIVIVVGKERSTAIIVMPMGEPHTVDLPAASEEALKTLHRDMDTELGAPVRPDMRDVLSDLWKIVVQPIIQELQEVLLIPIGSRIWWYPTSWASFLPLHAAGSYTKGDLNVPKLYISSYTPTLQALRRSRQRSTPNLDRATGTLIVSQAQTPGQVALPSVDEEVGIVSSLVPDAFLLSDDQGTRSNVLKELRNYSWIHLSCHGVRDPSDPFMSHFALHDGPLSLQDIIANDLPSADFAYLAACHSAAQDRTLPDEGLTLAGGMQFAGFKSVVGTMWAMADEDAPTWAEEFNKGLATRSGEGKPFDCTKAAESLHDAVIELRKKKVPMFRWINLVHYGI